jgi:serine/threonine protein phosphatase PrpC
MQCPQCGTEAPDSARFCELDGMRLVPIEEVVMAGAPACRCGAGAEAIDAQGYCVECGRFCGGRARDHVEVAVNAGFGGVTDRGKRHTQNEDEMAFALMEVNGQTAHIIIVCDGVSSSQNAEQASAAACTAALDALAQSVKAGVNAPDEAAQAIRAAIAAANAAVRALPHAADSPKDPPETTIVAALVQNGVATIGWVGDSRAYWFAPGVSQPLTHDHSWINDVVDAGEMSEEEASAAPGAHAITRCLGVPDADNEDGEATQPSVSRFTLPGAGRLLLCSDGLWNYAPQAGQIAALLVQSPPDADAATVSRSLVGYANAQGGRDNITVVIADFA